MTDAGATSLEKKLAIGFTLVASAGVHLVFMRMPDTMGDVGMYVSWASAVERLGIAGAYFSPQRFPIDYPPVFPYLLAFLSWLRGLIDSSPLGPASALQFWIPLPAALADVATAWLVYVTVKRIGSWRAAYASMLLYAFNPALLFATAYWGVMDSLNIFLAVFSLVLLDRRKPEWAWAAITLGVFTKPFAAIIALVVAVITLRQYGWARIFRCGAVSFALSVLILFPFLSVVSPTIAIQRVMFDWGNMPYVTANAHNTWWLITGGPPWVTVYEAFIGEWSYQAIGVLAFFSFWGVILAAAWRIQDLVAKYLLCALLSYGFFMINTHMHENHLFTVLPLLAIVAAARRSLAILYAGVTLTLLLNMVLHDPYLVTEFLYGLPYDARHLMSFTFAPGGKISAVHLWLTRINAIANVGLFVTLGWLTFRQLRSRPVPVASG